LLNKFSQLKIISRFSKYKKLVGNMKDFSCLFVAI
jgi:hypothetical protein